MTSVAEAGASFAWRLLATLEGGSLLLAMSALLVYTARNRATKRSCKSSRTVNNVLISSTTSVLGKELKTQLEARGCTVNTVTDEVISEAKSGAGSKVDALVVIGTEPRTDNLDGMAEFITQDVYTNLKLLESLSVLLRRDGCIAWTCAGENSTVGAFSVAGASFDAVIQESLQHIAKSSHCESIWVGRGDGAKRTAERLVAALVPQDDISGSRFSVRHVANKIGEYVGRWLKIAT